MRKYEIALLFDAGLEKKKLEKVLKDFEGFVKKSKGQIIEKEQWKERKLAYPIKKAESGIYFFAHYELETDKNDALLKDLNLNQNILRYLITIPSKEAKLEGEPKKVKRQKVKGKKRLKKEVKEGGVEKPEREKVEPEEEIEPKREVEKKPAVTKVEKVEEKVREVEEKPAYAKASAGKKVEEKPEEKPKIRKTVEESKKAKAREQKEKKVSEEKLDQEIDRILSDEDLL